MDKYILVIGATGNVGSKVVNSLKKRDIPVKVAYRTLEKLETFEWKRINSVYFDYTKPDTFDNALKNVRGVFLVVPPGDPNSLELVDPFIQSLKKYDIDQIVLLSAAGVEMNEQHPLRRIELNIIKSGIPYTFLRCNFFMQNFLHGYLKDGIEHNDGIFLPAGNGKTSFIDTHDIAEVAAVIFTEEGHKNLEYTLTGGEALDHFDVARILTKNLEKTITYHPLNDEEFVLSLINAGFPNDGAKFMLNLYKPVRDGLAANISDDVETILKRKPITFEKYVKNAIIQLPELIH